ncbi:MAG TPA: Lrp/AsnC family transcriptional regulator [Candidatus Nesterenkonia stercoripullorum]|uniref:Lrp/AsnC family transcriptional regulator n=1 Tax=Candidatus Nesterenkonia stercoripullorum TaxID=2838701 RepID=A0A9D1US62_9MICC|nr:Lrp/AsnC family transcriptional regulator [Candidatus Nesterenkonia stercoripullorum]
MHSDTLDEDIVEALREQPRASVITLAKELHAPRAVVAQRLNHLFSEELVRVVATVHPKFLSLDVIAHVSISTCGPAEELADWIADWNTCVLASTTAGGCSVVAELRMNTYAQLQRTLDSLRNHEAVLQLSTAVYVELVKAHVEHEEFTHIGIDSTDRRIIAALEENGRIGWKALAELTGKSPSAVRSRVHRILESRIARIIVVESRGGGSTPASVGVGLTLSGDSAEVTSRLGDIDGVEFAVTCIGQFDAILTVRGAHPAAIDRCLDRIRAEPGVRSFVTWFHLRSVKVDYVRGPLAASA